MLTEKETIRVSKFLSLILRHQPETIKLTLDANGWAITAELLEKLNQSDFPITMEILEHIVNTNSKKRFAFTADKSMIRASQGHSIIVDLGYTTQAPPSILYHGTAEKNMAAILKEGLKKISRQHVHLSMDKETAIKVGQRHGRPVVLQVAAKQMSHDGYTFFISDNGVWLTDAIPPNYLSML